MLAGRYSKALLLSWAAEVDAGFDLAVFADMLGTLGRFADEEIPVTAGRGPELREFFAQWAADIRT